MRWFFEKFRVIIPSNHCHIGILKSLSNTFQPSRQRLDIIISEDEYLSLGSHHASMTAIVQAWIWRIDTNQIRNTAAVLLNYI